MGEHHDNAFKKGNGANGCVVVIEPAKGTARLSPASAHCPHKHPHIDDQTIVQDDSQAVHPQRILPSPTLLCCTDQNRPRRPRYRSSKLPAAIASTSTHSPLCRYHRRHKRPQPRCTVVKTPVGVAGGCHCADKGLASASSQHQTPAVAGLPLPLRRGHTGPHLGSTPSSSREGGGSGQGPPDPAAPITGPRAAVASRLPRRRLAATPPPSRVAPHHQLRASPAGARVLSRAARCPSPPPSRR
jgi:hypothetical protein